METSWTPTATTTALAIGAGPSGFDALVAPGDLTDDDRPDLIGRTAGSVV